MSERLSLAIAWFPAGKWEEAVERLADLLDDLPADHAAYCRETEGRIKRLAQNMRGHPLHVSPLGVEGLTAHAAAHGEDAGSAEARSHYAAEVLRIGGAIPWPPRRSEPCWCGSGSRYKRCCRRTPAAPLEP